MAIGRTNAGGAGGASLNFKVVPGLTQHGTASENTIWVKTERLTGWYFAATQPENMQEGEVWFLTGTKSSVEFNALKKNNLAVYPLSAKQMISGALVDVEAMIYQGGEWVSWITYLYNSGDQCTEITGGWERKAYATSDGSVKFDADKITITGDVSYGTVCAGLKDFDPNIISAYKTIRCIVTSKPLATNTSIRVGIVPDYNLGSSGLDAKWISFAELKTSGTQMEIYADISNVDAGYPMISAFQNTADFEEIWLG